MNINQIESLEKLKLYKKEVVLIGLSDYQIKAIIDFNNNRVMYQVGDFNMTKLTDSLDKAINLITEMVNKDENCN